MIVTEETKAVAQSAYDYIVMNPEQHNQANWVTNDNGGCSFTTNTDFCGTTKCVAGTVAWMNLSNEQFGELFTRDSDFFLPAPQSFSVAAGELLGLTHDEQEALFMCFDDERALSALQAIAQGDEEKFYELTSRYHFDDTSEGTFG